MNKFNIILNEIITWNDFIIEIFINVLIFLF